MSTPTPSQTQPPTLTPEAQAVIDDFINQPGVTQDHLDNLQAAIEASPAFITQINDAVAQGHLTRIAPLTNPNAGGEYDEQNREMRLPLARLATPPAGPGQAALAEANASEVTFVLGHELQHGFNRVATQQAYTDFFDDVGRIAQNDPPPRDYTAPAAALIGQNRRDEAGAEIAGWNAIVGRVGNGNPAPTLQDIYEANPARMADFIDVTGSPPAATYALKPNLTINADMSMSANAANIEAMGQNYFDKPPGQTRLGALGNSDYANYYGAYAVSVIGQVEQHYNPPQPGVATPQVGLDLTRLKLSEQTMEENGIDLGAGTATLPYCDLGKQPPTPHVFQDTDTTHAHVSPAHAHGRLENELAQLQASAPSNPGRGLFGNIVEAVERVGGQPGETPVGDAVQRTAGGVAGALQEGMGAVRQAAQGLVDKVQAGTRAQDEQVETTQGRGLFGKLAEAVERVGGQPGETPVGDATQRTAGGLVGALKETVGAVRQQAQTVLDAVQPEAREQGLQVETAQGRGLLGKIAEAVERSGVVLGDNPVADRARISAGLLAEAVRKGFTEKDELFVGPNRATGELGEGERIDMFRRNGSPDPVENVVSVGRDRILSTPVENSYEQANAVLRNQDTDARNNAMQQELQQQGMRI